MLNYFQDEKELEFLIQVTKINNAFLKAIQLWYDNNWKAAKLIFINRILKEYFYITNVTKFQ